MDFLIDDASEELENNKETKDDNFFIGSDVTFINLDVFQEQYLTSHRYNDPTIRKIGLFSFKSRTKTLEANEDNRGSKLR